MDTLKNNVNVKKQVHDDILKDIVSGYFSSNEIITGDQLLERYSCSRSPLREALAELCSEGVMKSIPRYGYQVIPVTEREIREILQFRFILEAGCLRTCYASITSKQFERLEEISALCNREDCDEWKHWEYNERFHLYLISCAWNSYAYNALEKAMGTLRRAYAQYYRDKWSHAWPMDMRNHETLLRKLEAKDIEGAIKLLYADLSDFAISQELVLA